MVNSTAPEAISKKSYLLVPYALAFVIVVMVLLQLLNFEEFVAAIASYQATTISGSTVIAGTILILEIFSLPFLARLWLSRLARSISALYVIIMPLTWLILISSATIGDVTVANTGLLGDFIPIAINSTAWGIVISLVLASVWSFLVLGGPKALDLRHFKDAFKK